ANPFVTDYLLDFALRAPGTSPPPASLPGEPAAPITGVVPGSVPTAPALAGEPAVVVPPLPSSPAGFDDLGPTALTFGVPQVGQFAHSNGRHVYTLTATAGDVLQLDVEATALFDSDVSVLNPDGILVATSTSGVNSSLADFTILKSGTYQIIV